MSISPAKENILKKIREALSHPTPIPFPSSEGNTSVYKAPKQENEIEFAEQFTKLQGRFVYCVNHNELINQLQVLTQQQDWKKIYCIEPVLQHQFTTILGDKLVQTELNNCDVAITGCEYLVARTGSIVLSAGQVSGRNTSVYAPIHICIAYTHQLVTDVKDALTLIKDKYQDKLPSLITFATGPSRTADIEKTLVVGIHGPREVYVFLVDA